MDILLLILLSMRLVGKFKAANRRGAAKYILGMIGAVIALELAGLSITIATESFIGLLVCMAVGVALVVFIYRAGAKMAVSGEQPPLRETALIEPERIRLSALVCAVGLILAGLFGLLLSYTLSSAPSARRVGGSIVRLLGTNQPQIACFLFMGVGMMVLCAGYFLMAAVKGLDKNAKAASLFCGVITLINSFSLFYNSFFFRDIFIRPRSLSRTVPVNIPILLMIILLVALCLHLVSLCGYLNKPGYVFAVISIIVFVLVGLFEMYIFFVFAGKPTGLKPVLYGAWYRAPIFGFGFSAVTMFFLAFGRKAVAEGYTAMSAPGQQAPAYPPTVYQNAGHSTFPPFTGGGACDVCNAPLTAGKAFYIPNDTFYNSQKYREHYRQMQRSIIGMDVPDSIFIQMQAADNSTGSAVCENCVRLFQ